MKFTFFSDRGEVEGWTLDYWRHSGKCTNGPEIGTVCCSHTFTTSGKSWLVKVEPIRSSGDFIVLLSIALVCPLL